METIATEDMILDDLLQTFHRFFGLKVYESTPIKRGWLNLKWEVTTDSGTFLMKQYNKRRYKMYNPEDLSFACAQQVRLYYQGLACPRFAQNKMGWLQERGICCVTYEKLMFNEIPQNQSLIKIIDFLWKDLKHLKMTKLELLKKIKQNIIPQHSGTFRKGEIGNWKNEFNEEHKAAFKEIAGQLLIQLGYEKNYKW